MAEFGAGREYMPTRSHELLQPGRSAGRSVTLRMENGECMNYHIPRDYTASADLPHP